MSRRGVSQTSDTPLLNCLARCQHVTMPWNVTPAVDVCYNSRDGALAEQLRSGLQNRIDGCNSRRCLQMVYAACYYVSMPKRRSWTDEQLIEAAKAEKSVRAVLNRLSLVPAGGNYAQVKRRIDELAIDTSHFTGKGWNVGWMFDPRYPAKTLDDILTVDSSYQSHKLKKLLFARGIKKPKCELCGWAEVSIDGRIPVELDHINGVHSDNRLENLRILCPNCHSLQTTHRGLNKHHHMRG